jgi:hypothetical protein
VTLFFGGAAYLINNNLQIDASISTNFKDTPTVLYGVLDSLGAMDKCESTQAAVIMPNKRRKKKLKRRTETYGSN